MADRLPGG